MTDYAQIEHDFIERTLKVIEQYTRYVIDNPDVKDDKKFEVTLLMNCLLGLLIFPKEIAHKKQKSYLNWLSSELLTDVGDEWGIVSANIERDGYRRKKDNSQEWEKIEEKQIRLNDLVRQMRDAAAHSNFKVYDEGEKRGEIKAIIFEDQKYKDGFKATIPVEHLKTFVNKLAQSSMDKSKARKT